MLLIPVLLLILSWVVSPALHEATDEFFLNENQFESLLSLFLTVGGALIGATAIAFSLIMFAMQVNVERMPYGLFRKFSSDLKLMASFVVTFLLSLAITGLSLVPNPSWSVELTLAGVWGVGLVIILLLAAYRRALALISPTQQLAILVHDTNKVLNNWAKASERARPLLKTDSDVSSGTSEHDLERFTYLQKFPDWNSLAKRSVAHCISFSRRYAEQGDHEVAGFALDSILAINKAYIETKGKTFFAHNYFIDNPLADDAFITETLEHMRRNVQIGIARGDEEQIEQSLRAMLGLCGIYSNIDYSSDSANKSHLHLAAGYLSGAVETILPHKMTDVLMEGVRLMGQAAQLIILNREPIYTETICDKLALFACVGAANEKLRPVTQTAVNQLAMLTFDLMRCESREVSTAFRTIRNGIALIAKMHLQTPDTPLASIHSASLGAYYAGTSMDCFMSRFTDLTNAILNAKKDDKQAHRVIANVDQWADGLYETEKELFLLSIEKQSGLLIAQALWIEHISKLLLAISAADACDEHTKDSLCNSAFRLISILTTCPDQKGAIARLENNQITEKLFDLAFEAKSRGCDEVALKVRKLLLSWAFKAGKYQTGWGILERACCGLACLNLIFELDDEVLLKEIETKVSEDDAPGIELRHRAARNIARKMESVNPYSHSLDSIEAAMSQMDRKRLIELMTELANRLVPESPSKDDEVEQ